MKIITPLSRLEEIVPLVRAGADEFYCSVVPNDWLNKFGSSATSRRPFGNLSKDSDLEVAVERIHSLGKSLSLVMNAQHYTSEQLDSLLQLAGRFDQIGGDALIIGDPVLLAVVADENFKFDLQLSSIAACRNQQAAAFYRDLGVRRIIFPRDMTLGEMSRMIRAFPDIEFEAFILNDGCAFEEGVCHTIHLPSQLGGAICMDNYSYQYQRIDGKALSHHEQKAFIHNDSRYDEWIWYRFGCGFSVTEEGYPFGPCGLCAMPDLRDMGLGSVKIAGRDASLQRKVKSVEMVRKVMDQMDISEDATRVASYAREIRRNPGLCTHGQMCYYPEITLSQ